jgi:hypothetical protein
MSQLANQMQAKMAQSLDHLRKQEMEKVKAAGDAVLKLPKIDDSIDIVTDNKLFASMNNDDASMIVTQAAGGIAPGGIETQIVEQAIDFYGDRKATHERPQDNQAMSLKQEADIKRKIMKQLNIFHEAEKRVELLTTALHCGDNVGAVCAATGNIMTNYDPKFDPEHPSFVPDNNGDKTLTPGPSFIVQTMGSGPQARLH